VLAIDRWRKWRPSDEKFAESLTYAPPNPPKPVFEGFEGSISGQMPNFSDTPDPGASLQEAEPASIPPHDLAEWREPFDRWMNAVCVRDPRCFGGVGCLHIAYCEWQVRRGGRACPRDTFERLLEGAGFLTGEVAGVVLVSGLTFREDVDAVGL
jgi:hypothetical protein